MIPSLSSSRPVGVAPQYGVPSALGMTFDCTSVEQSARLIAEAPARRSGAAKIYVTPNIQHVAEMRRNPELRRAVREADLVTCDGFPLAAYARLSGCPIPGRITGREVVEQLMSRTPLDQAHVLFFLVDSNETALAVRGWADSRDMARQVVVEVAPQRFGDDQAACEALARKVRDAGTTILFLGVGAPKSELFASRFRAQLGGCWVLCIGQSVRVALGLVQAPPPLCVKLRLEWAWRIAKEPRRLIRRYVSSSIGFSAAIVDDLLLHARGRA